MNQQSDRVKLEVVTDEMLDVFVQKNKKYGNSYEESLNEFGLIAAVIQLSHKMNRAKQLAKGDAQDEVETIRDTFLDMANYSAMAVAWIDKESFKNELVKQAKQKLSE